MTIYGSVKLYREKVDMATDEYLNTPDKEKNLTAIQNKYGIMRQTLAKYLRAKGYSVVDNNHRIHCDEHIFDKIDTEEKAYWLGFLYADGCITSTGNRIMLQIGRTDLDHIIKFHSFLKCDNKIHLIPKNKYSNEECRVAVRSAHLWNQLNNKGCVPRKSLILTFPSEDIFERKELIYDFIRGYCDGDGCLRFYKRKYSWECYLGFLGTKNFLEGIYNFLGITTNAFIRQKHSKLETAPLYELRYSGVSARKVARLLYENSTIYLVRKYNICKQFCQFEEGSSKRKSSKIGRNCDVNTEVSTEITKGSVTP